MLLIVPTLLLLGTLLFFMLQFIPGDVASTLLASEENAASPEAIEKLRGELGLADPLHEQYFRWLGKMVRGDLGYSAYFNQSVWDAIKPKIDVTVTLAILGVIIAIVISVPAGGRPETQDERGEHEELECLNWVIEYVKVLGRRRPSYSS